MLILSPSSRLTTRICRGSIPTISSCQSRQPGDSPHSTIDFHCPRRDPSLQPLDIQSVQRRRVEREGRLSQFLTTCIDAEWYVRLYADELYIPERAAYRQSYMPHKLLVFGYGDDYFDILGFLPDGKFAASRIGIVDMENALDSARLRADVIAIEEGSRDSSLGNFGRIWLARYDRSHPCSFSRPAFIAQLGDYLSSHAETTWEGAGVNVYECFLRRLRYSLRHPEFSDMVSAHILWEHKKCMLARMRFLQRRRPIDARSCLLEAYREVVEHSHTLRMMVLRFSMRRDPAIIERAIERTGRMAELERPLLQDLAGMLLENG